MRETVIYRSLKKNARIENVKINRESAIDWVKERVKNSRIGKHVHAHKCPRIHNQNDSPTSTNTYGLPESDIHTFIHILSILHHGTYLQTNAETDRTLHLRARFCLYVCGGVLVTYLKQSILHISETLALVIQTSFVKLTNNPRMLMFVFPSYGRHSCCLPVTKIYVRFNIIYYIISNTVLSVIWLRFMVYVLR